MSISMISRTNICLQMINIL